MRYLFSPCVSNLKSSLIKRLFLFYFFCFFISLFWAATNNEWLVNRIHLSIAIAILKRNTINS